MTSAGIPARPPVAKKPLLHMAEYSINAHSSGYIRNFDFLTPWQQHPDVLYARPLVKVGPFQIGGSLCTGFRTCSGQCWVHRNKVLKTGSLSRFEVTDDSWTYGMKNSST
jgi:hypothetical protein